MWSREDDANWASIIKTARENPTEIFSVHKNAMALSIKLCNEYITTGDDKYFKMHNEFLALLLDSYLKTLDLNNIETIENFTGGFGGTELVDLFPELQKLEEMYQMFFEKEDGVFNKALSKFVALTTPAYRKHHAAMNMPHTRPEDLIQHLGANHTCAISNPNGNPVEDWGDEDYTTMITKFRTKLEALEPECKLQAEATALSDSYHKRLRFQRVYTMLVFYGRGVDFENLMGITPFFYLREPTFRDAKAPSHHFSLRPGVTARDILPTDALQKLASLKFKYASVNPSFNPDVVLPLIVGLIFIQNDPQLTGYTVRNKSQGKDPGFILVSPTNEKWFAKLTPDVLNEYYHAQTIMRLGIKMPESYLMMDSVGNIVIRTRDLSRAYHKHEKQKQKTFVPLMGIPEVNVPQAFQLEEPLPSKLSAAEQDRQIEGFLNQTFSSPKTRVSYAKLLLVGSIFGLSDFGMHGGNIGPIRTVKTATKAAAGSSVEVSSKFGIVDFALTCGEFAGPMLKVVAKNVSRMQPIFKKMFERLSESDFYDAFTQLWDARKRDYDARAEHYFVAATPKAPASGLTIVEETAGMVGADIKTLDERAHTAMRKTEADAPNASAAATTVSTSVKAATSAAAANSTATLIVDERIEDALMSIRRNSATIQSNLRRIHAEVSPAMATYRAALLAVKSNLAAIKSADDQNLDAMNPEARAIITLYWDDKQIPLKLDRLLAAPEVELGNSQADKKKGKATVAAAAN